MTDRYIVEDPHGPDLQFDGTMLLDERYPHMGSLTVYQTAAGTIVLRRRGGARRGLHAADETRVFGSLTYALKYIGESPDASAIVSALGVSPHRVIA